jgi:hypothetical protein
LTVKCCNSAETLVAVAGDVLVADDTARWRNLIPELSVTVVVCIPARGVWEA